MAWAYFSGGAAANNAHISSNLTIATFMSAPVYRLGCRVGRLAAKCTLESGEMFHILLLAWRLGRGIWAPHKWQPGTRQVPLCYPSGTDKLAIFHPGNRSKSPQIALNPTIHPQARTAACAVYAFQFGLGAVQCRPAD